MKSEFRLTIQADGDGYSASWITDVGQSKVFPLELPLSADDAADLRWYLEEFLVFPILGFRQRAEEIEKKIETWGEQLYDALFVGADGGRISARIEQHAAAKRHVVITICTDEPRIQRLPWEMLRDARGPMLFHGVTIRRQLLTTPSIGPQPTVSFPLRVLLIVARPQSTGFIDPRSSLRPMFEALERWPPGTVEVEFCEPPTLSRLEEMVSGARYERPFHVVHFDGHGTYMPETGFGALAFELDDQGKKHDLVTGKQLGDLLSRLQIPLVVLEACRSSDLSEQPIYDSVAPALLRSGVGSVVAFSHSVYVVASRIFVERFYRRLAEGRSTSEALEEARSAMYGNAVRWTSPADDGKTVKLQDWFIPQLYQVGDDPILAPSAAASEGAEQAVRNLNSWKERLHEFPPDPMYGFHGRAADLLVLERAFRKHAGVVLAAMGGMGKTALAREAAAWWLRTGRVEHAVFLSFEFRAGADDVVRSLGTALDGTDFSSLPGDEQRRRAIELFRTRKILMVWDNFESTLPAFQRGEEGGIRAFSDEERVELRKLYRELTEGGVKEVQGRILVTCRPEETGLPAIRPVRLDGLERFDSLRLLMAILETNGIAAEGKGWSRDKIDELLKAIDDHPLSISLIAPHLDKRTPEQIRDDLRNDLQRFTDAGAEEKQNRSLLASLEFSKQHLSEASREMLPYLAWFEGGVLETLFLEFAQIEVNAWQAVRAELEATALLRIEDLPPFNSEYLRLHPTLPYAADYEKTDREQREWSRLSLEKRFCEIYLQVMQITYQNLEGTQPAKGIDLMRLEEANFRVALEKTAQQEKPLGMEMAHTLSVYLQMTGRLRERDQLTDWMMDHLPKNEVLDEASCGVIWTHAHSLLSRGQADQAIEVLQELIALLEAKKSDPHQLGITYQVKAYAHSTVRRPALTLLAADRAIELLGDLKTNTSNRSLAEALADRAIALMDLGRLEEALASMEYSVKISRELGIHRDITAGLGRTAQILTAQQRWAEADQLYREALEAANRAGDLELQGTFVQHLALLQREFGNFEQAIKLSKEALSLFQQTNNVGCEMHTCGHLGVAEMHQGRFAAAEAWFERSHELAEARGDRHQLAVIAQNVGTLYQLRAEQTEDAKARVEYLYRAVNSAEESLTSWLEMDHQPNAAMTYSHLGNLHGLLGDLERAEELLRQGLQISEPLKLPEVYKDYANLAQIAHLRNDEKAAAEWQTKYEIKLAELDGIRRGDGTGTIPQELVQTTLALAEMVYAARTQAEALTPDVEEALAKLAAAPEPLASLSRTLSALAAGENAEVPSGLPQELAKIVEGLIEALKR